MVHCLFVSLRVEFHHQISFQSFCQYTTHAATNKFNSCTPLLYKSRSLVWRDFSIFVFASKKDTRTWKHGWPPDPPDRNPGSGRFAYHAESVSIVREQFGILRQRPPIASMVMLERELGTRSPLSVTCRIIFGLLLRRKCCLFLGSL